MKKGFWVLVVDGSCGRLVQATVRRTNQLHVEEEGSIENSWEGHEHGRPSVLSGGRGYTYASSGQKDQESIRRFAREVNHWLEKKTDELKIDRLAVFSPPRFLGALRHSCNASMASKIKEHKGNLAHLTPSALAKHRALTDLIPELATD